MNSAVANEVASAAPLLEARDLSLLASGQVLVEGLNWQFHAGERWCVIGRNAVGKTTLLRALAGLSVPKVEGAVSWQGRPQHRWPADAAATARALMQQQSNDRFSMTVKRLLALSVCVPGLRDPITVLDELDAGHLAGRDLLTLSGGERQRVALAQCAMQGAPLMMLDEPVAFQDPAHQALVARWLVGAGADSTSARQQPCFIVTSHDVNWIARVATHVLALTGFGGWFAGPVDQLLTTGHLERVYGCGWRRVGDVFVPLD